MKNENNENLSELLAQFLDAEDASRAAADIAAGEQMFTANPVPAPSPALLADIRRQMTATNKKHRHARHFTRRIAAAAMILLVLGTAVSLLQRHGGQYLQTATTESFWQETLDDGIDAQLTQLDQTEIDMPVVTLETNGNDMSAVNDLADELNEIEGTFWEG